MPARLIGDRIRNVSPVILVDLAKNSLNMWCIGVDVGHHNNDVSGAQCRVAVKGGQKLVVQDLNLALGAMSEMKSDRPILVRIDRGPR